MRINVTGAALATLLVFCTGLKASAQGTLLKEARYEVNLTVGIVPGALVSSNEFPNSTVRHNHDLYYFYEPYYSTGMFPEVSMDANIILKKWLKVGGKLGYYTLWGDLIDPKTHRTIGKKEFSDFSLAGQVRFTFYEKPPFSVYAGIAAGATYRHGNNQGHSMPKLLPAYEVLPLGYQISYKSVYGIIECAFGSMVLGGRFGIGYRF
jgi:hypothetical protein